jgi:hypothetical protein
MEYVLVHAKLEDGSLRNFIWQIPDGMTAEAVSSSSGLEVLDYAVLDLDKFERASIYYPDAFSIDDGVPAFDLNFAIASVRWEVKANTRQLAGLRFKAFSSDYVAAQALLPAEARDPEVQTLADELAKVAADGDARAVSLNSVSTIDEAHTIALETRFKLADYLPSFGVQSKIN